MYECVPPPRFRSTIALAASLFFLAPLAAQAALYLPGATLDPSCAPADSNCGVSSIVASGTANSIPYYAANGSILSATSTFQLLANGTASTTNLIVGNSLTLGTLSGFLKAVAGVVATALVNLASDVTGILPIGNGGTGLSSIIGNRLLYTNSAGTALLEVATSTLYGASTGGKVLGWDNTTGGIVWVATTTSSNYWTSSGSNLFNNTGTYVGIGTTSPSQALSVHGNGLFSGNITIANLTATGTLTSYVTTGTAPLAVNSTTKVANLNADLLDGFDSSAFGDATAANQTTILSRIGTNSDSASMSSSLFAGQKYIVDKMANGVKMMSAEFATTKTHAVAAKYCYDLSAAAAVDMGGDTSTTFTDWRLPTAGEAAVFEGTITSANYIWTTTVFTSAGNWLIVSLSGGYWSTGNYNGDVYYVRCVR